MKNLAYQEDKAVELQIQKRTETAGQEEETKVVVFAGQKYNSALAVSRHCAQRK